MLMMIPIQKVGIQSQGVMPERFRLSRRMAQEEGIE